MDDAPCFLPYLPPAPGERPLCQSCGDATHKRAVFIELHSECFVCALCAIGLAVSAAGSWRRLIESPAALTRGWSRRMIRARPLLRCLVLAAAVLLPCAAAAVDVQPAPVGSVRYSDAGNSGTAKTINWNAGLAQLVTLTGNCTFTFTQPFQGMTVRLLLKQDATGSRTVTWPAAVRWSSGTAPTLTTTANQIDIVTFFYDGTNYYGQANLNFAP